jgi:hypothetical protein
VGIWNRDAARRLGEALRGLAPDVIHLHQWTRSLSPDGDSGTSPHGSPASNR